MSDHDAYACEPVSLGESRSESESESESSCVTNSDSRRGEKKKTPDAYRSRNILCPLACARCCGGLWDEIERARGEASYLLRRTKDRELPRASTGTQCLSLTHWCRCTPGLASLLPEIRAEGRVSPAERASVHIPVVAFSFCSTRIFVRLWLNKLKF